MSGFDIYNIPGPHKVADSEAAVDFPIKIRYWYFIGFCEMKLVMEIRKPFTETKETVNIRQHTAKGTNQ